MASKRNYSRYFIILQEDEKGYSTDNNKFPTGYAKVERKNDKCKISYYVQNLKKSKDPYYMMLICDRKTDKRLVKLGPINIDDYGRAEVSYEYSVENVANSSIPMENIKGASIVRLDGSTVYGILTGFVSGTKLNDWKSYAVIENKERIEDSKEDQTIENEQSAPVQEEKAEENKKEKVNQEEIIVKREESEKKEENNIFDEYEKNIENSKNINIKENRNSNDEEVLEENKNDDKAKIIEESKVTSVEENKDENENIEVKQEIEANSNLNDSKESRNVEEGHKDSLEEDNLEENEEALKESKDDLKENKDSLEENRDYEKEAESIKESTKELEKSEDVKSERRHDHKKDKEEEEYCKEHKEHKEQYKCEEKADYSTGILSDFFNTLAYGLEEVKGVCPEVGKCKWHKVKYKDLKNITPNMDFNKYTIVYYPMISYYPYIQKYGHYLMGYKCNSTGDVKYLVYAIPGTKAVHDQPFGGSTGFVTWVCRDYGENREDSVGYWLMFYDFKNSRIVVPVKR